eukprot:jgi/Astpho2/2852/Aster-01008
MDSAQQLPSQACGALPAALVHSGDGSTGIPGHGEGAEAGRAAQPLQAAPADARLLQAEQAQQSHADICGFFNSAPDVADTPTPASDCADTQESVPASDSRDEGDDDEMQDGDIDLARDNAEQHTPEEPLLPLSQNRGHAVWGLSPYASTGSQQSMPPTPGAGASPAQSTPGSAGLAACPQGQGLGPRFREMQVCCLGRAPMWCQQLRSSRRSWTGRVGDIIYLCTTSEGSEQAYNGLQVQTGASLSGRSRLANATDCSMLPEGVSADDVPAYTGADDWGAGGGSSDDDNPEPAETGAAEEAGPSQQAPAASQPEAAGPSQQPASPPARRPRHPAVQRLTKQQSRGSLSGGQRLSQPPLEVSLRCRRRRPAP